MKLSFLENIPDSSHIKSPLLSLTNRPLTPHSARQRVDAGPARGRPVRRSGRPRPPVCLRAALRPQRIVPSGEVPPVPAGDPVGVRERGIPVPQQDVEDLASVSN
uniref:(northern house mosquito) hypothetical protein n=1 Tax=Culex pipiens TaxID=7175 RepID=A0A8D8D1P9_CULPI